MLKIEDKRTPAPAKTLRGKDIPTGTVFSATRVGSCPSAGIFMRMGSDSCAICSLTEPAMFWEPAGGVTVENYEELEATLTVQRRGGLSRG